MTYPSRIETRETLRSLIERLGVITVFVFALAALSIDGRAQTQGSIFGTAKDAAGAVVSGASVTLTNMDEGTSRETMTNATGDYLFSNVIAGHYSVKVAANGFAKWSISGVTLAVRQELRIDVALAISAVEQSVQVTGENATAIDTDNPTISGTFTADAATNLPVNTRASFSGTSAAGILGTLPGVQDDASGISVQGALPYQVEVTVDGITLKDPAGGGFIKDSFPSTESISEIRSDGVMANAEYGDPAQIVVTTKGGTNAFHGSGFWYYQNSAFNAIPYTYPTTTNKADITGNTFGGSIGGPIRRNHTFFYGGYEGWRHPAQVTINEKVPSTLMKQGDFSKYVSAGFAGLRNPYNGTSYGKQIPTSAISQIAANTLKQFYPDPNVGDPTLYTDDGKANYQANVDGSGHSNQFDVRGDQYFGANQKFLIWGRFTWKNFPINKEQILNLPSSINNSQSRVLKVDTNWTLTPSLINEGGFGFTRYTSGGSNPFNGHDWTVKQGWQGLQNLFYNGIPEMDFNNIQSLDADRLTGLNKSFTYEYADTLTWIKGKHAMKFGGDIEQLEAITPLGFNGADNYGTYTFNSKGSAGMFTGVDFADFLLGLPNNSFYDVVRQDNDGLSGHYHLFAQDEWRLNPHVTLIYGVRYELHPGYYDKFGDIGNFDPSVLKSGRVIYPQGKQDLLAQGFLASANACNPDGVHNTNNATINGAACMQVQGNSDAGFPSGLKKVPHLRFMPRLGFAYRPFANDKWAIRGGFSIYNINMLGSSFYSLTGTVQAYTQQFSNTYDPSTHAIGFQWPQVHPGAGGNGCTNCYGTDYFGTANSTIWKDPYTEQWALSVDHDFGSGYAGRVSYIGSNTRQLVWAPDENTLPFSSTVSAFNAPISARVFPNWGRINTRATGANASYNSLQFDGSHRLQNGLEFNSTFTWAKNLADNQGPANNGFGGEGGGQRATSILDRHVDFGDAYGTRRLRWNTTALYDLPIGRGRMIGGSMGRAADAVVGGWRLSSIFTVQTGPYLTPYFPNGQGDPSGTGSGLNGSFGDGTGSFDGGHRNQHPDQLVGVSTRPHGQNRFGWTNATAFACPGDPTWTSGNACLTGAGFMPQEDGSFQPIGPHPLPIGRFGNSHVGSVEGPGLVNLSAGLSKSFSITERVRARVEGTFTNVLNHTNLGDPITDLSNPSFGLISNSISSDFGGARTGQVAARVEF
ncbi:TonB-dependent receptor [Occallatibacter riparius]|uniref:TonB-dependent receptor n=1 Tax=Occallatibacter riparius TaxID=1002689 RepID=A0A9J7BHF0_9BACT|nr:TonB-dependent receptor [Occallatibacter riparius]UWZ81843.1 TonB-dependent receptor [Occallatibacter riparius]